MHEKNSQTENPVNCIESVFSASLAQAASGSMSILELVDMADRLKQARHGLATELYKTWLAFNKDTPGVHAAYFNFAVCLNDDGDVVGGINALRQAIRLKPDFGPASINLGNLLERSGHIGQAVEAWLTFAGTLPELSPEALNYRVLALKQAGRALEIANKDEAAEDLLRQCLEFDPKQKDVVQHWIALRQRQCKWPTIVEVAGVTKNKLRSAISPLSAANCSDDPIRQMAISYNYARRTIGLPTKLCSSRPEPVRSADPPRRLRIGYLSSDLRNHAVGFAMTDVLETHDRNRVEVFAYYCGIEGRDVTQLRCRAAVEHWKDINILDDVEAAEIIQNDEIDILIDLNGYTKDARTKVFAMRPAPISVNWFGFPGTMGSPYHHYIIADPYIIPPDHEQFYTERVIRLPCYQPNDRRRPIAPAPLRETEGLPDDAFVFCCLNGMQKLTERCFNDWMSILHNVPGSVLWLLAGAPETNERVRAAAECRGIDRSRLIFANKRSNPEHLARIAFADLVLDTFPYGAHTTASDALWAGVPILTIQGRSFASRVCSSLVAAAGLDELICRSQVEYVQRAIELANNPTVLASLRSRLREGRDSSILFDTPLLVRSLEALFEQIHEDRLAGKLPKPNLCNLDLYHEICAGIDPEIPGSLQNAAYLEYYRQHVADVNMSYPVLPDGRLWTHQLSSGP